MEIRKVGVVGAGTMGSSIAEVFAFNGYDVKLKDQNTDLARKGLENVKKIVSGYEKMIRERPEKEIAKIESYGISLDQSQKDSIRKTLGQDFKASNVIDRISLTDDYSEMGECDYIVEAVFENEKVKGDVFSNLSKNGREDAVIASNTSSLSITKLSSSFNHPERVLINHFFNPPYLLPLIEVVPSLMTDEAIAEQNIKFLSSLKNHRESMVPVMVREREGFIVNRILIPMINDAGRMLDENVSTIAEIDKAMKKGAGMPMGPFELADMIGLDVVKDVMDVLRESYGDHYITSQTIKRMVEAKKLGKKSKIGFYSYK
ncbi:MAG: 3-hydroxyacyl-CoA dehydrogenase family protein [Thermoplasmata archaeon]